MQKSSRIKFTKEVLLKIKCILLNYPQLLVILVIWMKLLTENPLADRMATNISSSRTYPWDPEVLPTPFADLRKTSTRSYNERGIVEH